MNKTQRKMKNEITRFRFSDLREACKLNNVG